MILASLLMGFAICLLLFIYLFNEEISNKMIVFVLGIIALSFLIFCFHLQPPESFDLYRYFDEINYVRSLSGKKVLGFLFGKTHFMFLLLEYITSLFSDNHFIFLFSIPITIGIYCYLLIESKKGGLLTSRQIIISIFVFFSIINTIHLMSGIRNALAVSFYALALYLDVVKKNKISYFFYIFSVLTHTMTIILFTIRFITFILQYFKKLSDIVQWIILCWSLLSSFILKILKYLLIIMPIGFLNVLVIKLESELGMSFNVDLRIFVVEFIQVFLIFVLIIKIICSNRKNDVIISNLYYLGFFIIGSMLLINIFTRTRFIFAFLMPFIFVNLNKIKDIIESKKYNILQHVLLLLTLMSNVYYIYYMYCNGYFI